MILMYDALAALSSEHMRSCIHMFAVWSAGDTNIDLTKAESLLWDVSDTIQTKRRAVDHESVYATFCSRYNNLQ